MNVCYRSLIADFADPRNELIESSNCRESATDFGRRNHGIGDPGCRGLPLER